MRDMQIQVLAFKAGFNQITKKIRFRITPDGNLRLATNLQIQALPSVGLANLNGGSSGSNGGEASRRGKEVCEAADRVLVAVNAKERTRWSRAILANRLKLKFRNHKRKKVTMATRVATGNFRSRKSRVSVFRLKGKTLPAMQSKLRFLGRLVPGCQKQPFPVILEETTEYISAVQMQIRVMTDLADRLSASSSTSTSFKSQC